MKYRKFGGQIPKIQKISEKRGNFFGWHVDVHKRVGQSHVDRGIVKSPIFVWMS